MTRTGQLELTLGTDQASERDLEWMKEALFQLAFWPLGKDLTADSLTELIGRPHGSGNAIGAAFHAAAEAGYIKAMGWTTSSRPERHGAAIRIWRAR